MSKFKGLDHLFLPQITQGLKKGKLTESIVGFHLDIGHKLEKAGTYTLKNCKELIGGMYEAELHFENLFKPGKTFFPRHWDETKLISKISEACHNAHSIKRRWDGTIEIKGIVEEGFQIMVKLSKKGKFLTSYPELSDIL